MPADHRPAPRFRRDQSHAPRPADAAPTPPTGRGLRVIVTGASSGLGAAVARALASEGHRIALVARRVDRLEEVAAEVARLGGTPFVVPADLADPAESGRVVAEVVAPFGGLDGLVNNAGLGLPRYFAESDPRAIADQVAVNLAAPMLLARHALPELLASRGTIVNIGSAITAVANPILGAYGATKAGLASWNDALRREVRHRGVAVCHVDLGPIPTEFFDAVRLRSAPGAPSPLGIDPPTDGIYNALRDRPPALIEARLEVAARRVAGLLTRPRRRLALPLRIVVPIRLVGVLFHLLPRLGDLAITAMIRRVEREEARNPGPAREPGRPRVDRLKAWGRRAP